MDKYAVFEGCVFVFRFVPPGIYPVDETRAWLPLGLATEETLAPVEGKIPETDLVVDSDAYWAIHRRAPRRTYEGHLAETWYFNRRHHANLPPLDRGEWESRQMALEEAALVGLFTKDSGW